MKRIFWLLVPLAGAALAWLAWPIVLSTDWCGEGRQRQAPRREER